MTLDYTPTIRAEIEVEVARLKRRLEARAEVAGWPIVDDVAAEYVELGYLVNLHHGHDLFGENDTICGLPISINRACPRTIRVGADDVYSVDEWVVYDEDGEPETRSLTHKTDLFEETIW
jgi:hypothetical protein